MQVRGAWWPCKTWQGRAQELPASLQGRCLRESHSASGVLCWMDLEALPCTELPPSHIAVIAAAHLGHWVWFRARVVSATAPLWHAQPAPFVPPCQPQGLQPGPILTPFTTDRAYPYPIHHRRH